MKKQTKIAIIASAAVAAVAVIALVIILVARKKPVQASPDPQPTIPSAATSADITSANETCITTVNSTAATRPSASDRVTPTTAVTQVVKSENGLPYEVTAQFSVSDANVFVFPEFASDTYVDTATGRSLPYRLYVPTDYDESKRYPVALFLHGAGDRGNDNTTHIRALERAYGVAGDMLSQAIVLAPQCPEDGWWNIDSYDGSETGCLGIAVRLLRTIMAQYRCDKERVYVTGLSMGGYGTWSALTRYGYLFAAGVPICGWGDSAAGAELAKIPIWVFHSTDDDTVPYQWSLDMVNAIKNAGGRMVRMTTLDGVGHSAWDPAFGARETFLWMFGQTKSKGLAGDDSYSAYGLFHLLSPKGEAILTEADIRNVGGRYIGGSSHLVAELTPEAGNRLRKAYAAGKGQEFTVEYLGQPYYRFRPVGTQTKDEFVFALLAKEHFRTLLQKM